MCPFCHFLHKYKNEQKFFPSYCTKPHQICTQCSHIQCASELPISVSIFQSISEWQRDNEDWSAKNAVFAKLNWLPWQCPLSDGEMNAGFIKPLHSCANPENLVKIHPVIYENLCIKGLPLEKNIGKIYSSPGRLGGLN